MHENARELLKGYVEVSSLPMLHARLDEAINNPRKSMADIARIIREDAGLSARLLRIVNSAFYNFPSRVETISQAVTIVGTQQLSALALATSVMNLFRGIPEEFVTMDSFWRHGIACGLAARALATFRREANVERFFVAGILHDIGRLVIYTKATEEARKSLLRCRSENLLLYDAERDTLGYTHAVVGGVLLDLWKLPVSLQEIIMYHHNPEASARYPIETALIHVADIIAHTMDLGSSGEHLIPPLDRRAWDRLGLSTAVLSSTFAQVEQQFEDTLGTLRPHA